MFDHSLNLFPRLEPLFFSFITRDFFWFPLLFSNFLGTIHSTQISRNFGPTLNGSVQSNRKSFEKTGLPFEVDHFSRLDRSEFWLNGSCPLSSNVMFGPHAGLDGKIYTAAITYFSHQIPHILELNSFQSF